MNLSSWLSYTILGTKTLTPRRRFIRWRRRGGPRRGPDQAAEYRAWIRRQPSVVSDSMWDIEPAHTGPHGYWQKGSGYTCIPLTHEEHAELHRIGPTRFQAKYGIDFDTIIEGLFTEWSEAQRPGRRLVRCYGD